MRTLNVRPLAAVAVAALLAACGSDSSTSPTTGNPDVAKLVASASTAGLVSSSRSAAQLPSTAEAPTIDPASCPFSAANQLFECAPVTRDGLTFKTAFSLRDAGGQALTQPVAANVAAARVLVDITGSRTFAGNGSSTVVTLNSHSDHTLSGLLTNQRVLNGTDTEHDTTATTIGNVSTHTAFDVTTTTANLQLPQPLDWPAAGTITTDAKTKTVTGAATIPTAFTLVTTFNGTSKVATQIRYGDHTTNCTIDLSGASLPSCG